MTNEKEYISIFELTQKMISIQIEVNRIMFQLNKHGSDTEEALEKRVPMKPVIKRGCDCCPSCGKEDGGCTESWHRPYCCNCGQALDWSDYDY